jgi:PEP-CTERM motif
MKNPTIAAGSLLFFAVTSVGRAQGFINLDFEHPTLPLNPVNGQVPTTAAMPGWIAYTYGSPASQVLYNTVSLGAAAVSLQGPGSLETILQGSYSVELQPSTGGPPGVAAIAQTALIPASSMSFIFFVEPGSGFQATVGGQNIPLVQFGSTANYNILGGDISAFAGQTEELRFTGGGILDDIQFLTSPIPEPSSFALGALGTVLLGARRWRKFTR